jgi:nucleoid DNA-binding protein
MLKRIANRARISRTVSPHVLRHTFAVTAIQKGISLPALQSIVRALRAGDKVEIRGFGRFDTRQRAGRMGRNPKSGQAVAVPAKTIPFFKPSKEVRALINSSGPDGDHEG